MALNEDALAEICWIVNQRNRWAHERHAVKMAIKRLTKKKSRSPEQQVMLGKFRVRLRELKDLEQRRLNSYTKRLRKLLRDEPGADLVRDHMGGYKYIELFITDESGNFDHFMILDQMEIRHRADLFEASKALDDLIG